MTGWGGGKIKQNQNQGNFGFVCRVVTLSLNNSPRCSVKFLLDVLGVAFMVSKQMKADLKFSYSEFSNNLKRAT